MIKFDVVLSTYNGESFLQEQIESILAQRESLNSLIIRDDGSSDNTLEIIESFESSHKDKIVVIRDGLGNLGVRDGFFELAKHASQEYVVFSDQDDVWEEHKLKTIRDYIEQKGLVGSESPILIHSDLTVVDQELNVLSDSFIKLAGIVPSTNNTMDILLRNSVTGCASVANKTLIDKAMRHKSQFDLHDKCLAAIASIYNGIHYIDVPLIKYRQHDKNVTGAPSHNDVGTIRKIKNYYRSLSFKWEVLSNRLSVVINEANSSGINLPDEILVMKELADKGTLFRILKIRSLLQDTNLQASNLEKVQRAYFTKS
ncbi:glycosyltransferase family 2 protein [Vibrio sp. WXL103]|uniref:glycosyltransferase family 2 protein n=1 Tax=Vibrio sp. WXL103 TaxID=3450710 RepID=UPI003EC8A690